MLEALVAAGDRGLEPRQLPAASALADRTCRAAVDRLERRGLASRATERGRIIATLAGRSEVSARTPGAELLPELSRALECFPSEAHRAFARLLLSGVVVRHHLADVYPEGWGGFVCTGPTQTGKTSLAKFACRVFGLDHRRVVRQVGDETPGSLFARRVQTREGWTVEASPLLALPFICLDEWDKASEDVRREGGRLLLGLTQPELEGVSLLVRPQVMVCLNTRPGELGRVLHDAYVRRSVVLDTQPLRGLLGDVDEAMRVLFNEALIPRIDLATTRPPASALPTADRRALREGLRQGLTQEGWTLCDVESLSRLALGRAALLGDVDLARAALATAFDYLAVATTVQGHTIPGALTNLACQLGATGPLAPDAAAAEEQQLRRGRLEAEREARALQERAKFTERREFSRQQLVMARGNLARVADPQARAVAKALSGLAAEVGSSRTAEALESARTVAQPWLEEASRLIRAREEAQRAAAAGKREERVRLATERRRAAADRQAEAERRRIERPKWIRYRRWLAGLVPVEDHAALMVKLQASDIVSWVEDPPPGPGAGWLQRVGHHVLGAGGHWVYEGRRVDPDEAAGIWLAAFDRADRQVIALGGQGVKRPSYTERSPRRRRAS